MAPPDDVRLWSRVPPFRYEAPLLPLGLERAWPAFAALMVWAAFALLALRAVARRLAA